MNNIKELKKQFKLGTPVWYISNEGIHSDVVVAQHNFSYAVEIESTSIGERVNIGDTPCIVKDTLLLVLAYSHRLYTTDKVYLPIDIKEHHKVRSIDKLYLSKESLLEDIEKDVINNNNSLTQSTV